MAKKKGSSRASRSINWQRIIFLIISIMIVLAMVLSMVSF